MKCREGADGDGTVAAEKSEREVEKKGEQKVGGDGGEEKGPRGAPRLGVAPPEPHDGGVPREIVD